MPNNTTSPKVSVILPTYNRARIVERSIKSVLDQTFEDLELVIVDDGSTDNTENVVEAIKDKRIKYIKQEKNLGLSASRNTGIKQAQGEFIANQDSDDLWLPTKLEKELAVFKKTPPKVGIVYSRLEKIFDHKTIFYPHKWLFPKEGNLHKTLLRGNFITMQSALAKKQVFAEDLFDESLNAFQDWELWLRISKKWNFKYVDETLCKAYVSEDSITKDRKKRAEARKMIFEKHRKEFKSYPKIFSRHAYMIAGAELKWGKKEEAKKYAKEAWLNSALNLKYLRKYLSVLF